MLRYLAVSVAVAGLLTVATAPAEAGSTTGTWKHWNPYMAQAAPALAQAAGRVAHGSGPRPSRVPQLWRRLRRIPTGALWTCLRVSPPRPGLVSGGDTVRARVGGTRAAVFASIQQRSSVPPWPLLTPSRSALVKK